MESSPTSTYPVQFGVNYPDRDLNRLSSALRILWVIPIMIVLATLGGHDYWNWGKGAHVAEVGGGVLFVPVLLMIVFREKYPRWLYDWNLELLRFSNRVFVYLALMNDTYPSTDEPQSVSLELPYPDVKQDLNRYLPIVKWLLAIPHLIVLVFLWLAAIVCVICAWFAILFTGRYPRGLFGFVEGVFRWSNRVNGYAFTLVTDEYPPFRLSP